MTKADDAQFEVDESRPTVGGLLDHYIRVDRELFPHESPKAWRGSSIGYCLARQYLERSGVKPARDLDSKTLRVFALGDSVHFWIKNVFRRSGLLVEEEVKLFDPKWEVSGHMDLLVGGPVQELTAEETEGRSERWGSFLESLRSQASSKWGPETPYSAIELKSAGSFAMQKAYKDGPQPAHMMQIATYYLLGQRNPDQLPVPFDQIASWEVTMIGKEKLGMLTFELSDVWINKTRETIERLNGYWAAEEFPPCTCGQNGSLPQKYCSYYDPDKDRCCDIRLLESVL